MTVHPVILAATLVLSGCTAPAHDVSRTYVVTDDWGGNAERRKRQIDNMRRNGSQIMIDGHCLSACTMYLGLPSDQVCATHRARFGFHAATNMRTGKIDSWWTFRGLRVTYHPGLWAWFETNAAHLQGKDFATLTGAQMIERGWVREC